MSSSVASVPKPAPKPAPKAEAGCGSVPISDAEILAAAETLQVPRAVPGGGPRLLVQLLDERLGVEEMAARLGREPSLVVRVLRVANSPFYGQPGQVDTLARAAQILGARALRGVAAAACFDGLTRPARRGDSHDLAALREHSLATACAAQALAQRLAPEWAEQAFIAGLLHDIGQLVVWRLRPQVMEELGRRAAQSTPARPAAELEVELLGVTHAHCGGRLLAAWRLPPALCHAVAGHDAALAALAGSPGASTATGAAAGATAGTAAAPDLERLLALGEMLALALIPQAAPEHAVATLNDADPWAEACRAVAETLPDTVQQLASAMQG